MKHRSLIAGHNFYTATWNTPGAEMLVLGIHGLTGNYAHMLALAEGLAPHARFMAYDLRGRGDSDATDAPSSLHAHAQDAVDIIKNIGCKRVIVLGHSMGAYIGALVAGMCPDVVAGLVMLDGAGKVTQQECDMLTPALSRLSAVFDSTLAYEQQVRSTYAAMGLRWNAYVEAAMRHEIGPWTDGTFKYKGDAARIREDLQACVDYNHLKAFAGVTCPALLVYASGAMGEGKPLYHYEAYHVVEDLLQNLDYYKSPANHYTIALEYQTELIDTITRFMRRCTR